MQFAASIGSYLYKSRSGRGQGLHPEITKDGFIPEITKDGLTSFSFNPVPYIPFMVNERKMDASKSQSLRLRHLLSPKQVGALDISVFLLWLSLESRWSEQLNSTLYHFPTQRQVMFIDQTLNQPGNFTHCCRPAGAPKVRFFPKN